MPTKICVRCGVEKPFEELVHDKAKKSGVRGVCKKCVGISGKSYFKRRYEDEGFKENWLQLNKEYRDTHKDSLREKSKEFESNNERKKYKQVRYKQLKIDRPLLFFARWTIRGHKQRGHVVDFNPDQLEQFTIDSGSECPYCGKIYDRTTWGRRSMDRIWNEDHLTLQNIRIICQRCNMMKNNLTHDEFLEQCKKIVSRI